MLRTDDVVCQMSVPTCLERMARTLGAASDAATSASVGAAAGARALLRPESPPSPEGAKGGWIAPQDEAYIATALSGSLAAMRHPLPQINGDTRINGNRNLTKRIDEITRAVRWFRIAPPTGIYGYPGSNPGKMIVDPVPLTDTITLTKADTWYPKAWGTIHQGAPARVVRELPYLPVVVPADSRYPGTKPWVLGSKHPNGALAVAAIGRTLDSFGGWIMPLANVTLFAGKGSEAAYTGNSSAGSTSNSNGGSASTVLVGVFGQFASLTIVWEREQPLLEQRAASGVRSGEPLTVWAQDLTLFTAVNITDRVAWCGPNSTTLFIPGRVIAEAGMQGQSPGDISDPGLVLAITQGAPPNAGVVEVLGSNGNGNGDAGTTAMPRQRCPAGIPRPPAPPPPPPPAPPPPPSPSPGPPISPGELNGTWTQMSTLKSSNSNGNSNNLHHPLIDIIVTNGGGDVTIIGHNAGKWDHGTGVILDNNIDVHCFGSHNFATHQVGTTTRVGSMLQITWQNGANEVADGEEQSITAAGGGGGGGKHEKEPFHWAVWVKAA